MLLQFFLSLFFFPSLQRINFQAVGSTTMSEETTKEEEGARVQVWKQLVMESGTFPTACSHLHSTHTHTPHTPHTPHTHHTTLRAPSPVKLQTSPSYLWLSSACSNKISQSCWGVLLISDSCHGHTCFSSLFLCLAHLWICDWPRSLFLKNNKKKRPSNTILVQSLVFCSSCARVINFLPEEKLLISLTVFSLM